MKKKSSPLKSSPKLALVLSAGGARGAYEAGVIHYIRTALPPKAANRAFNIMTGTSVGAINTAGLAATAQDPLLQGESLKRIWFSIRQDNIYSRDLSATTHFLGSTLGSILRNFLTINPFHLARRKGPHLESFLNTDPLKRFLSKVLAWKQLSKNVLEGPVDAVAVSTTNITHARTELFFHKKPDLPYEGPYVHHEGPLNVHQVLASAAIPIIFPPHKIGKDYYADGGLRLFTPMSPAIQLGADRLIVVGLRKKPKPHQAYTGPNRQDKKMPTIGEQMGRLLNGLFLDRVDFDMEQMERLNTVVEVGEKIYGKDFLKKINLKMKQEKYETDIARRGLRPLEAIEIQPSEYINQIFMKWFRSSKKAQFKLSAMEKLMVRLLDIDPSTGSDLLSYLTFAPNYIRDVFDLGFEDAKSKRRQLIEMMGD
ncbi:MAG: patatin-like phospholipase family protein [Deltaproteobacteria bacterium]|nr:patatin-like phospholipase family protein [Deltaproteobacteria bacterium]